MLHQFKDYTSGTGVTFTWKGQAEIAPSASTVYLQIYDRNLTTWETIDSDSATAANTDFTLTGDKSDLTDYKDINNVVACRVYQLAQ